ncbi:MAG: zinc-binding dehydrogenase [Pseudomonadota bacterium]
MAGIASAVDLPDTARAAVLRQFKSPVRIEEVPIPRTLEPHALLVKIEACSICGTDVHLWQGNLNLAVDLPVILGHEMIGRIMAFGDDAEYDSMGQKLRPGDRVLYTHTACGHCYFCTHEWQPTLCENRGAYMFMSMENSPHLLGGFAEYGYVLPNSGRIRVPDSVPDEHANLASCALHSVMNSFDQLGSIAASDRLLIQGVGPLGLLATAIAKIRGARKVYVCGAPDDRLALAKRFGADEAISITATTPEEREAWIKDRTDGRGADIVMEFTGNPRAFVEGLRLLRKGGRYVVTGLLGGGEIPMAPSLIVTKQLKILGSFSGSPRHYWKALDFLDAHAAELPIDGMITGTYGLDDVTTALERMAALQEIKPIIRPHTSAAGRA